MRNARVWTGLVLTAGVLFTATAARAAECRFERTLSVAGNGSLEVSNGSGDVKVVPGDGAHVHVVGLVRSNDGWLSGNSADVQHICDQPPIEQNGSNVRVGHVPSGFFRQVSITYAIEVPRAFEVSAGTGSGNLELRDLGGSVNGNTGSGDVRVSNLRAGTRLSTGSGNIAADGLGGNTKLGTGSGNIHARFGAGGDVRAESGSGEIRLENVEGGLTAHTASGDVEASGRPHATWEVGTSSGEVKLHLPAGAGFTLEAGSASGDIRTSMAITVQGGVDRHHVHGTIAGGGPEVRIGTASGDIHID